MAVIGTAAAIWEDMAACLGMQDWPSIKSAMLGIMYMCKSTHDIAYMTSAFRAVATAAEASLNSRHTSGLHRPCHTCCQCKLYSQQALHVTMSTLAARWGLHRCEKDAAQEHF